MIQKQKRLEYIHINVRNSHDLLCIFQSQWGMIPTSCVTMLFVKLIHFQGLLTEVTGHQVTLAGFYTFLLEPFDISKQHFVRVTIAQRTYIQHGHPKNGVCRLSDFWACSMRELLLLFLTKLPSICLMKTFHTQIECLSIQTHMII